MNKVEDDSAWTIRGGNRGENDKVGSMSFLGWTAASDGFATRDQDALLVLKSALLKCLDGEVPTSELLRARIEGCRNRGELILARADVMQLLSRQLGEEVAATRLKGLWGGDRKMRLLQAPTPGHHSVHEGPVE